MRSQQRGPAAAAQLKSARAVDGGEAGPDPLLRSSVPAEEVKKHEKMNTKKDDVKNVKMGKKNLAAFAFLGKNLLHCCAGGGELLRYCAGGGSGAAAVGVFWLGLFDAAPYTLYPVEAVRDRNKNSRRARRAAAHSGGGPFGSFDDDDDKKFLEGLEATPGLDDLWMPAGFSTTRSSSSRRKGKPKKRKQPAPAAPAQPVPGPAPAAFLETSPDAVESSSVAVVVPTPAAAPPSGDSAATAAARPLPEVVEENEGHVPAGGGSTASFDDLLHLPVKDPAGAGASMHAFLRAIGDDVNSDSSSLQLPPTPSAGSSTLTSSSHQPGDAAASGGHDRADLVQRPRALSSGDARRARGPDSLLQCDSCGPNDQPQHVLVERSTTTTEHVMHHPLESPT
ncbi:unnamed protein product, partial [Amoebophrya sp. A120]|eukprot:GSA120T00015533001.1